MYLIEIERYSYSVTIRVHNNWLAEFFAGTYLLRKLSVNWDSEKTNAKSQPEQCYSAIINLKLEVKGEKSVGGSCILQVLLTNYGYKHLSAARTSRKGDTWIEWPITRLGTSGGSALE